MAAAGGRRTETVVYGVTVGLSAFSLLRDQLAWMRERGWDVHLVTTPDEQARAAATREGVQLHAIPMRRDIAPFADLRSLARWVRTVRSVRPDAVNVGTPKAALLGGLAARLCGVPRRIYVVRGLRLEGASGVSRAILWAMEWLTLRLATDVVVVSASLAQSLRRHRLITGHRVWLIGSGSSNGVDASAVRDRVEQPDALALRSELGFSAEEFVVGFVGRLQADKGIDTLIAAFEQVPTDARVRVLLVGASESDTAGSWLDRLGERGVYVGESDDPWKYYAAMDVLVLPTRREGFPNVVLEAAAAGVPTITTDATGAVDSVVTRSAEATGVIVPVDDAGALAVAVSTLARDRSRAEEMGRAARSRAVEQFDPELIWLGIESVLRGAPAAHVRAVGSSSARQ